MKKMFIALLETSYGVGASLNRVSRGIPMNWDFAADFTQIEEISFLLKFCSFILLKF